jgi:hypothetical protein
MKYQENSTSPKPNNCTKKASKSNEEDKVSTSKFKEAMIKIMNEVKEKMDKQID